MGLLERVMMHARTRPFHVAIDAAYLGDPKDSPAQLTYQDVVERAGAWSAGIAQAGVPPGAAVLVPSTRGAEAVCAMLGCWMARVVWVPVDAAWPAARRVQAARDAQAVAQIVAGPASAAVPDVQRVWPATHTAPSVTRQSPHAEAYRICTSGSSGKPKVVRVRHAGVPGLLDAQCAAFALGGEARVAWLLSPGFDASLSDVGCALWAGATLVPGDHTVLTSGTLRTWLDAASITHADVPPSVLPALDAETAAGAPWPAALRTLVVGGEPADVHAVRALAARVRLVSVYGPTEATVCTSVAVATPTWRAGELGRPIAGMRYALRTPRGLTMYDPASGWPASDEGELCIGGPGLAMGYMDSAQTDARFLPASDGHPRLYRTGDLVRTARHSTVFLGRMDRQLKRRGQLVAPEEVEAVLCRHPAIEAAAVGPCTHHGGLLAVVEGPRDTAAIGTEAIRAETIRQHVATQLPASAVPCHVVHAAALPQGLARLPNGKRDISGALRAGRAWLTAQATRTSTPGHAPGETGAPADRGANTSSTLSKLCTHWSTALGIPVGPDDDVYDLGADSIASLHASALCAADGLIPVAPAAAEPATPGATARIAGPALFRAAPTPRAQAALLEAPPAPGAAPRAVQASTRATPGQSVQTLRARAPRVSRGPAPAAAPGAPRAVLVTGANGFLGRRVVRALLATPDVRVFALVRGPSDAVAQARMDAALGGPCSTRAARLTVKCGDITLPDLGLSPADAAGLADAADAVVHGAAQVSLADDLEMLWAANVQGTHHVLQWAQRGRAKTVHHMSTLAVWVASDAAVGAAARPAVITPDDVLPDAARVFGGYAQSKVCAEHVARSAHGPHTPVHVHRLGLLTAGADGEAAPADWLTRVLRGLYTLQAVPDPLRAPDIAFDVTPVDAAAAAVVRAVLERAADHAKPVAPTIHHITTGHSATLADVRTAFSALGRPLQPLAWPAWRAHVEDAVSTAPPHHRADLHAAQLALARLAPDAPDAAEPPLGRHPLDVWRLHHVRFAAPAALVHGTISTRALVQAALATREPHAPPRSAETP